MATKTPQPTSMQDRVDGIKTSLGEFHEETLLAAEKLIDSSLATGNRWQDLFAKMLGKGTDLLEKQQDLALTALEGVKGQYDKGHEQFMQLMGWGKASVTATVEAFQDNEAVQAVVAEAATVKETVRKAMAKDDLTRIKGVGPKVASLLEDAGIHSYEALANTAKEDLQDILKAAGTRYQSMDPTPWIKQAKKTAAL